ncbi:MAG: rhomboid family intramembrane serine protease [Chthoniobacterales bacterium]
MEYGKNHDYEPCFCLRGYPIYATTLLVAIEVIACVAVALLLGTGNASTISLFDFSVPALVGKFQIWRIGTYPLLNAPDIWFALQMYFLFQFGREVERFLGRKRFLLFYGALVLVAPIILILTSLIGHSSSYAGSYAINFSVFIAFVVIYPNVGMFFTLTARWVAIILMAVFTLTAVSQQAWQQLGVFWGVCICAAALMQRFCGRDFGFISEWLDRRRDSMRVRHSSRHIKSVQKDLSVEEDEDESDVHASIDPLLDKIAKHGISSLTAKEKQRLERARETLLDKERKH